MAFCTSLALLVSAAWSQQDRGKSPPLAITHVTLINPDDSSIRTDMTVLVESGRIARVQRTRGGKLPAGAVVLDGSGKFLIPSLWDMHVHLRDPHREFLLFLANGVLGVRDMGGAAEQAIRWRGQVESGALAGPRIVAAGPILDGARPASPEISLSVPDAATARRNTQLLKATGADFAKVYDGLSREAYLAIAEEAARLKLPLAGHVPIALRTLEASQAGQRSIEHQVGLRGSSTAEDEVMESESAYDLIGEAMRANDFSLIPETLARRGNSILDGFSPERAQRLYRALARNGTHLSPTLVTARALTFVDDLTRRADPRARYVPAATREYWKPEKGLLTRYRTPAYIEYRKREYARTLEQIPVAHRAGVSFLAGTDTTIPYIFPGFSLHDELQLFVQAGLSPMAALKTATSNPARFFGFQSWTGSIRPGRTADLVLLEASPLKNISNTQRISAVIVRGELLRRADLDALLRKAEAAAN